MKQVHRIFLSPIDPTSRALRLTDPDEVHHVRDVLRSRPGDELEVVDGKGCLIRAAIETSDRAGVSLRVLETTTFAPGAGKVVLACAIPKKAKFEAILEKTTELGVDEIIPMVTARTEVRPKADGAQAERWERVIVNACKQCKRVFFPKLYPVMTFDEVVLTAITPGVMKVLIPWLEGERLGLSEALEQPPVSESTLVLIGPEGDFTPEEVARAKERGALPVSLGPNVLKVDTAALAILAILMAQATRHKAQERRKLLG